MAKQVKQDVKNLTGWHAPAEVDEKEIERIQSLSFLKVNPRGSEFNQGRILLDAIIDARLNHDRQFKLKSEHQDILIRMFTGRESSYPSEDNKKLWAYFEEHRGLLKENELDYLRKHGGSAPGEVTKIDANANAALETIYKKIITKSIFEDFSYKSCAILRDVYTKEAEELAKTKGSAEEIRKYEILADRAKRMATSKAKELKVHHEDPDHPAKLSDEEYKQLYVYLKTGNYNLDNVTGIGKESGRILKEVNEKIEILSNKRAKKEELVALTGWDAPIEVDDFEKERISNLPELGDPNFWSKFGYMDLSRIVKTSLPILTAALNLAVLGTTGNLNPESFAILTAATLGESTLLELGDSLITLFSNPRKTYKQTMPLLNEIIKQRKRGKDFKITKEQQVLLQKMFMDRIYFKTKGEYEKSYCKDLFDHFEKKSGLMNENELEYLAIHGGTAPESYLKLTKEELKREKTYAKIINKIPIKEQSYKSCEVLEILYNEHMKDYESKYDELSNKDPKDITNEDKEEMRVSLEMMKKLNKLSRQAFNEAIKKAREVRRQYEDENNPSGLTAKEYNQACKYLDYIDAGNTEINDEYIKMMNKIFNVELGRHRYDERVQLKVEELEQITRVQR